MSLKDTTPNRGDKSDVKEKVCPCQAGLGVGIPKENLDKLFELLFTTKAKGIGLGLAMVKGLVEGHRGRVKVQSAGVPGKGCTFVLTLPSSSLDG